MDYICKPYRGGLSGEGDDVGVWRGEKEDGTAEEKGVGENGGNGDGSGGAERSGEKLECVYDGRLDSANRRHKVTPYRNRLIYM